MLIEQYELRFTHQIIDTKNGKVLEKLGTYYTTIFNELPNIFDIPARLKKYLTEKKEK